MSVGEVPGSTRWTARVLPDQEFEAPRPIHDVVGHQWNSGQLGGRSLVDALYRYQSR
jgi:hypothetical protein